MRARVEQAMSRYGQRVTLLPGNGGEASEVMAFVQPVRKRLVDPPVEFTPLGPVSEQRWVYVGPAGVEVKPGDRMICETAHLAVQEVQDIFWTQDILYRRAVLRREKEAAV